MYGCQKQHGNRTFGVAPLPPHPILINCYTSCSLASRASIPNSAAPSLVCSLAGKFSRGRCSSTYSTISHQHDGRPATSQSALLPRPRHTCPNFDFWPPHGCELRHRPPLLSTTFTLCPVSWLQRLRLRYIHHRENNEERKRCRLQCRQAGGARTRMDACEPLN